MEEILCWRNIVWKESCTGGKLLEGSPKGGIPCKSNSVGVNPVLEGPQGNHLLLGVLVVGI